MQFYFITYIKLYNISETIIIGSNGISIDTILISKYLKRQQYSDIEFNQTYNASSISSLQLTFAG